MKGSMEENSALVMSLWHCMFAWFFADTTNIEGNRYLKYMEQRIKQSYLYMKSLRFFIHGVEHNEPGLRFNIPRMVDSFRHIAFSGRRIPPDVWVGELHSLMEELVSIHHVLKDYQLRRLTMKIDEDQFTHSSERDVLRESFRHIQHEPKSVVCLLTLWYWLAVWCSPKDYHIVHSKHQNDHTYKFMLAIEKHHEMLAICLIYPSPSYNSKFEHDLQILFGLLMDMLKSDLQHWIDALDHFTYKMTHAGLFRGQVKKVLHAARALEIDSTQQVVPSAPPRKALPKKDVLKEQMHDALIGKGGSNDIVDKLGDVVQRAFVGVAKEAGKEALGVVKAAGEEATKVVEAVGEEATKVVEKAGEEATKVVEKIGEEATKVVEAVGNEVIGVVKVVGEDVTSVAKEIVHGVEGLHHGVEDLGHAIGEGMQRFAEGAGTTVHKIGSFLKGLFS